MEENIIIAEEQTQAENMGNEVQGTSAEGKEKAARLFTQEEVNRFVQSRISRMQSQIEKESKAAYEQKLAELEAREMKLLVKEKLSERGLSKELADIITCTDEDDLNRKLDTLSNIYGKKPQEEEPRTGFYTIDPESGEKQYLPRRGLRIGPGSGEPYQKKRVEDPIRKAMGLYREEQ